MSAREYVVECERCGTEWPESEVVFEHVPGATLVWCPDCLDGSDR